MCPLRREGRLAGSKCFLTLLASLCHLGGRLACSPGTHGNSAASLKPPFLQKESQILCPCTLLGPPNRAESTEWALPSAKLTVPHTHNLHSRFYLLDRVPGGLCSLSDAVPLAFMCAQECGGVPEQTWTKDSRAGVTALSTHAGFFLAMTA